MMNKLTLDYLVKGINKWTEGIVSFYESYNKQVDDFSFNRLFATMIDEEKEYSEYFSGKIAEPGFKNNFDLGDEFSFSFYNELPVISADLQKVEALKGIIRAYQLLINDFKKLSEISGNDTIRAFFTKLASDKSRQVSILKDRLELEELY